ncbi:DUF2283 domain-containing protein [Acaricomes phytoseiuli]|uniref:DUF2283 domain-containing protein n=1 Tax=Acaricomes phytoseiuli TaxID=291968 RepID=UPI00222207AE|nr:DUF2283 domain-containing protein [Acaricomes phytoseiuli]MCW1249955.1 DUF2283 domain-containing protein [Acaricomes phytoseiuli]
MKITYNAEADAAYIMLVDDIAEGSSSQQIHSIMTPGNQGDITLDFDSDGRLLGIEVLNAQDVLPSALIAKAGPAEGCRAGPARGS